MCLLITGKSNAIRNALLNTEGLIENIFKKNPDGLGAMFCSVEGLHTHKLLPTTVADATAFINWLPDDDRALALHWRWRTHGDTDLENCHPYAVIEGEMALMHNGVLSQGNKGDLSKSDTWHYIKDVVRPMIEVAPTLFNVPAYAGMIASDIGPNNKFAVMDKAGTLTVLNQRSGVMHEDIWFSNTYAWTPGLLIPSYRSTAKTYSTEPYVRGWTQKDIDDYYGQWDRACDVSNNVRKRHSKKATAAQAKKDREPGKVVVLHPTHENPADNGLNVTPKHLNWVGELMVEDSVHGIANMPNADIFDDVTLEELETNDTPKAWMFSDDDLWAAMRDADVDELATYLHRRPYFVLNQLYASCEFVNSDAHEYSELDAAIIKKVKEEDRSWLATQCARSETRALIIAQVIGWYGEWVGKAINKKDDALVEQASAEITEEVQRVLAVTTANLMH